MPRKKRELAPESPIHITARCLNQEWFRIPPSVVFEIYENYLFFLAKAFGVEIYTFVLMSNHIHFLARFSGAPMPTAMSYFMREMSRSISSISGRINQTWGAPYHSSIITDPRYFRTVYKYILQNPVRAGASDNAQDFPYSSLYSLLGNRVSVVPIESDNEVAAAIFQEPNKSLRWLNIREEKLEGAVRVALRHKFFGFPKNGPMGESAICFCPDY